jgi:PAS domain-containing protein
VATLVVTLFAPARLLAQSKSAVERAAANQQAFEREALPFLKKHCLDCHSGEEPEGEVALDAFKDAPAVAADQKTWQRVIEMLRSGAMPPEDAEQPPMPARRQMIAWIERTIYDLDCDLPTDLGRVTIRRLNRAEYNNTVRDLLGVTFKPADDFPSDDVGSGFDNIGDVLTVPPILIEKYLTAAERIADEAIIADPSQFVKAQHRDRRQLSGEGSADYDEERRRWTISSEDGVVSAEFEFSRAGEYRLRAFASQQAAGDEPAKMELRLAGKPLKSFEVSTFRETRTFEITIEVAAGQQKLSAHFLNDFYDPDNPNERRRDRNLRVYGFEVDGPLDVGPGDFPEIHRKLINVRPEDNLAVLDAAKTNLRPLINRAFRRPATEEEVERFAGLVDAAVKQGDSFEQAMQVGLIGVLVSPHFLFRAEHDKSAVVSDYELASRLSYFLWSSMPDDELFALAAQNKLQEPSVIEQQVRRMLADPKSEALVQNFATQWLNLRLLDAITPDPKIFPDFDAALKADMRRETELFTRAIIHEDRSVLDFLDGRFTYVNQRLAKHYGIPGIEGDEFLRVSFTDRERRGGVLTQASILTLTSNPARTSPVKRGKWILENILGTPPPDPPMDVPALEETAKARPGASLRKQLEIHRTNAVCASCHKTMDQLGFGLENFDAVGRWRERDGEHAVDATGELPGGDKFNGPLELAGVLKARRLEFARCLSQKMLTFALGRELRVQDRCTVDKIVEAAEKQDFRFSALVVAIATSDPFRKRTIEGAAP